MLGEAQRFDSFKHIDPELLDYLHDVCELQCVEFLYRIAVTALDVS